MSQHLQIEINGHNLVSIKEAAKRVSYSRDYVARLAREQKIVASQIGRQWFVDLTSLKNFSDSAELEQTIRKRNLSHERKRERIVKDKLEILQTNAESLERKTHSSALLGTFMILTLGLFSGFAMYNYSPFSTHLVSSVKNIGANVAYPVIEDTDEVMPEIAERQSTPLNTTIMEYPLFIDEQETRSMKNSKEGVFVLASEGEVRSEKEVETLFSDDVQVKFISDNEGVITLERDEETVEFPFVSVPAKTGFNEVMVNENPT